jgi:hypothetical protein
MPISPYHTLSIYYNEKIFLHAFKNGLEVKEMDATYIR